MSKILIASALTMIFPVALLNLNGEHDETMAGRNIR